MNVRKTAAILLIAVFANPLCCCLSAFAATSEAPSQSADSNHSCCQSAQAEAEKDLAAHPSEDCQHALQKDSKISQSADTADTFAKPALAPIAFLTTEMLFGPALEIKTAAPRDARLSSSPDFPTPQAYCVFLL